MAKAHQRQGIGEKLLHFVEANAREAGGRLVLIETSSLFHATQLFYGKLGYSRCGQVPNFYADGDSKVIYAKQLVAHFQK